MSKFGNVKRNLICLVCAALVSVLPIFAVSAQERTTVTKTYNFGEMTEEELKNDWTVVREDKEHWRLENGKGLVLNNQQPGLYGNGGDCKNIFLLEQTGDYTVETKITLSENFSANFQQFVLLIYQDDDNYIKLNYGMNMSTGCQFLFEKDGSEKKSFGVGLSAQTVFLRVIKSGNVYTAYVSSDGNEFLQVGESFEMELSSPKIGIAAHNDGCEAPVVDVAAEYVKVTTEEIVPPTTGGETNLPGTNEPLPPKTGDMLIVCLLSAVCALIAFASLSIKLKHEEN